MFYCVKVPCFVLVGVPKPKRIFEILTFNSYRLKMCKFILLFLFFMMHNSHLINIIYSDGGHLVLRRIHRCQHQNLKLYPSQVPFRYWHYFGVGTATLILYLNEAVYNVACSLNDSI